MDEMWLGGNRYVRKDANSPWMFPENQIIKKMNLEGLITFLSISGEIIIDIKPNTEGVVNG